MRQFLLIPLLFVVAALTGCGSLDMEAANAKAPAGTGFSVREMKVDGETHRYGLYVPHSYHKGTPTPTIVFLHGVIQAGSDGKDEMTQGLGPNVARYPERFPCLIVFPQSGGDWTGEARDKLAMAELDDVAAQYTVDPDRVVLTGLSNGGYGVWHIGADHIERFAALVPVSGGSDYDAVPKLTRIPIWCFHKSGDPFIGSSNSRGMVKQLKEAGANVQYTQFDGLGHDCWDEVYGDPKVIEWMLGQRRGGKVAAAR